MARLKDIKKRADDDTKEIWRLLHRKGAAPALPSLIEFTATARAEQIQRLDTATKKAGTLLTAALASLAVLAALISADTPLRIPCWLAYMTIVPLVLAAFFAAYATGTHWTFPRHPASVIRAECMDDDDEIRRIIVDHYTKSRLLNAQIATDLAYWVDAAKWLLVVSIGGLAIGACVSMSS